MNPSSDIVAVGLRMSSCLQRTSGTGECFRFPRRYAIENQTRIGKSGSGCTAEVSATLPGSLVDVFDQ